VTLKEESAVYAATPVDLLENVPLP
jgi:hypothetical protein